jgi:hypothetical protein
MPYAFRSSNMAISARHRVEVEVVMTKCGGKVNHDATINYMQRTIAALGANFDKFKIPDEDSEDSSNDEKGAGASSHSNQALNFQSKKKGERS